MSVIWQPHHLYSLSKATSWFSGNGCKVHWMTLVDIIQSMQSITAVSKYSSSWTQKVFHHESLIVSHVFMPSTAICVIAFCILELLYACMQCGCDVCLNAICLWCFEACNFKSLHLWLQFLPFTIMRTSACGVDCGGVCYCRLPSGVTALSVITNWLLLHVSPVVQNVSHVRLPCELRPEQSSDRVR